MEEKHYEKAKYFKQFLSYFFKKLKIIF